MDVKGTTLNIFTPAIPKVYQPSLADIAEYDIQKQSKKLLVVQSSKKVTNNDDLLDFINQF